MPRCCPAEYRRRVIDLIESAVSVAEVADGPGGDGSDDLQLVEPGSQTHPVHLVPLQVRGKDAGWQVQST